MSTLDPRHLPSDRLATTDQDGARIWIIPAGVKGFWKTRKTLFHIFLLAIFVLTPWLRWQGEPLVLFDILNRQFLIFGHAFGAHDAPLLFFVLAILGFSLILVTALWGRVWCGWACPQTVFIEQVFRRIETWVIGPRSAQIECREHPYKGKNFFKLVIKWTLFVMVCLILAHTFVAYFVSWENLLQMAQRPPQQSWSTFLVVFVIAGILLFDFAWFREQFCIIMCPYGRFQSVLMDQNSLTITYDHKRGEPRTKGAKVSGGDCVDCFKCVSVCPTGIDIRNGNQLECIGCTACIDACDEVMSKLSRPLGLIRYAAQADIERPEGRRTLRPRVILYVVALLILGAGLAWSLLSHQPLYVSILRQGQLPYVETKAGVLNNYRLHLKNPSRQSVSYQVRSLSTQVLMSPPELSGEIEANGSLYRPFFVTAPDGLRPLPQIDIEIRYRIDQKWQSVRQRVQMVGPSGAKEP